MKACVLLAASILGGCARAGVDPDVLEVWQCGVAFLGEDLRIYFEPVEGESAACQGALVELEGQDLLLTFLRPRARIPDASRFVPALDEDGRRYVQLFVPDSVFANGAGLHLDVPEKPAKAELGRLSVTFTTSDIVLRRSN